MEDINLHFTGDFHAIAAANNLLAAMVDNHVYWGNELGIDVRRVTWKRVVDMNDRALRQITNSLGGPGNGYPREDGFDIVVASEVMAIFCLATDLDDLTRRLGNIIVARTRDKKPIYARDLKADGAMAVLLRDALSPNLVQTLEGNPAFVHGGPFANIAHGCNSVMATQTGLRLGEYVVTEAGFGADLGAEKFFDIKCRKAGLKPDAAVIVATVRALKMHGGVAKDQLGKEDLVALKKGFENLARHIENVGKFGVPAVVAHQQVHRRHGGRARADQGTVRRHGLQGHPVLALGRRQQGHDRTGQRSGQDGRERQGGVQAPVRRRDAADGEGAHDRQGRCMAPRTSRPTRRSATCSRTSLMAASATTRCASPRRSTASPPIRR